MLSIECLSAEERAVYEALTRQQRTRPPDFLEFDLAPDGFPNLDYYPGAVTAEDPSILIGDGALESSTSIDNALFKINSFLQKVAALGGDASNWRAWDESKLRDELAKFHGAVELKYLPAGTTMYRTVGLMPGGAKYGATTNRLDANYWEARDPNTYSSVAEWRAATAVKWEWNGDHGHIRVTLKEPVLVLSGTTACQALGRNPGTQEGAPTHYLPGGALQYCVIGLPNQSLTEPLLGRDLSEVIHKTNFGSMPKP